MKHNKGYLRRMLFVIIVWILMSPNMLSYANSYDDDIANRILCRFEDGQEIANLRSTDYAYYKFRSKSAMTSTQSVTGNWNNKLLTLAGYDFNKANKSVLGREINPSSIPEGGVTANGGEKVSAFDRFGMAGLTWSSYQGEWKYYFVNACRAGQVSPTTYGTYYEGRLEPQSTYNEAATSKDPRTIQFNKGAMSLITSALIDKVSNFIFSISKFIVTLTITFVGFSFADITSFMGMSASGGGSLTSVGMFVYVYEIIFKSLIIFTVLFTAVYVIYKGLIKRQLRLALNTVIRSIVIFLIATIMSLDPGYWIGIPNKIANYGQTIVLSTMAGIYNNNNESTPQLCTTEIGSINEGGEFILSDSTEEQDSQFSRANKNMRSLIGCQLWETMIFRPWVRGQFGTDYEELESNNLGNVNSSWVGSPSVPLGGGETSNNWALFHLSTQTDAHSELGDNNFRTVITGVNSDWWRVVDALSNYDEGEVSDTIGGAFTGTYTDQTSFETTDYWQTWIGNNSLHRLGIAIISLFFAVAGSLPPLVLSFSSAVYGFGITLLMIISPFFFLMGTWGGKGDGFFMGWVSSLANTILKRIGVSILLILSISLTLTIMNLVYSVGFVKSFMLMIVSSFALIKNKDKMLDMMSNVDFGGGFNPVHKAQEIAGKSKRTAQNTVNVGAASLGGAVGGKQTGQGAIKGATSGALTQLRNTMYQSTLGMTIIRELDIKHEGEQKLLRSCVMCFKTLGTKGGETAYRDDDGNYYCENCAEEIGLEVLYEVSVGEGTQEIFAHESNTRKVESTGNRSYVSNAHLKASMKPDWEVETGEFKWDEKGVQDLIRNNLYNLAVDTLVFKSREKELGYKRKPPIAPEPLHKYIDIPLLNLAWTDGNLSAVQNTYKLAWTAWYSENAKNVPNSDENSIKEFLTEIENMKINIDEKEAEIFIKKDAPSVTLKEEEVYIYKDGRLILNSNLNNSR